MSKQPLVDRLSEDLSRVLDTYREEGYGLTVAEAVGVLEVLKYQLIVDSIGGDDEDSGEDDT